MDASAMNGGNASPVILVSGGAVEDEEAAAITAAIERFTLETAPVAQGEPETSGWQRAALIEGVTARQGSIPPGPKDGFPPGT